MFEYEKKVPLTRDEYVVLADKFRGMAIESQTNYYFDTDDLYMNQKGITCRVRAKSGKYKTTIKNHNIDNSNCSIEEDIYEGSQLNFKVFEALGMHLQGTLITTRKIIYKDAFCEIVLDWNSYLGCDDFEIEIEYTKEFENRAMLYLKSVAEILITSYLVGSVDDFILRVGKGKSKSERFFERKLAEESRMRCTMF